MVLYQPIDYFSGEGISETGQRLRIEFEHVDTSGKIFGHTACGMRGIILRPAEVPATNAAVT
jgi:hypothetical protein